MNKENKLKLIFNIWPSFGLSTPTLLSLRLCVLCSIYRPVSFNLVISKQVSAKQLKINNYFSVSDAQTAKESVLAELTINLKSQLQRKSSFIRASSPNNVFVFCFLFFKLVT